MAFRSVGIAAYFFALQLTLVITTCFMGQQGCQIKYSLLLRMLAVD